jgi:adenylate kinase family enzyme
MEKEFNIIDAYLKYNKQFIIIISGLSGSNKSKICQKIATIINFMYLNTRDYIQKDKYEEKELSNKKTVKLWYNYNWDEIIKKINENKNKGIIICVEYFPSDKLNNLYIDQHYHIKLSRQNLIKKRLEYIHNSNNKDKKEEFYDDETENLIINQATYPYYLDIIQKTKINKFINVNEMIELDENEYLDKIVNIIIDNIIEYIVHYLKNKNLDKYIIF